MDPDQGLNAREIVAEWDERRLAHVLRDFGEERHAGAIARAIVRRRARAPIETTLELVETISAALPAPARFAGGHPAKRSFQALRIAVNDELEQLDRALPRAWGLLREGGVLAGISFQSLEDRRVKRFLAARAQGCICPPDLPVCACGREPEAALLTRRSIVPSAAELERNPRAASARLRAARKLAEDETQRDADAAAAAAAAPGVRRAARRRAARARAWRRRGLGESQGPPAPPPDRPSARPARPRRRPRGRRGRARAGPAGRSAGASREPRALDRLIRGRIWIALIAFALIGIVTLQLLVLQLNAGIGRALVREAQLQRENAALQRRKLGTGVAANGSSRRRRAWGWSSCRWARCAS